MDILYRIVIKNEDGEMRVNANGVNSETLNHIISEFKMYSDIYISVYEPEKNVILKEGIFYETT